MQRRSQWQRRLGGGSAALAATALAVWSIDQCCSRKLRRSEMLRRPEVDSSCRLGKLNKMKVTAINPLNKKKMKDTSSRVRFGTPSFPFLSDYYNNHPILYQSISIHIQHLSWTTSLPVLNLQMSAICCLPRQGSERTRLKNLYIKSRF